MTILIRRLAPICIALLHASAAFGQATITITNTPAVAIPDNTYVGTNDGNDGTGTDAGMVCTGIDFSAQPPSTVLSASLEIGVTHTWLGDLTMKLTSPDGSTLPFMVRPFGNGQSNPSTDNDFPAETGDSSELIGTSPLTFDDAAAADAEEMGQGLGDEDTVCLDDGICDYFPNPDVAAGHPGYVDSFAEFVGETAEGVWDVCVGDAAAGDLGTFDVVSLTIEGSGFVVANESPMDGVPGTHSLSRLFPNPFNPSSTFSLVVAQTQDVMIEVVGLLGQPLGTLHNGVLGANEERIFTFEARELPSGLYIIRVEGEHFVDSRTVTLLK